MNKEQVTVSNLQTQIFNLINEVIRSFVKEELDARQLSGKTLIHIKNIKQKKIIREFLSQEEFEILTETECESLVLKNVALFSALTGLRWSDIIGLKWSDIQKTSNGYYIHIIQKKTTEVIVCPINETALMLIEDRGKPNEQIFKGFKYSYRINCKFKSWLLRAGIHKKISFNSFRHYYPTLLLNQGLDVLSISNMLGHKKIETTLKYAKFLGKSTIKPKKR
jgi:integrase